MINLYVNDIRKSLENECYFSALSLSLMMPDICGMAEYPKKEVWERYIKWCDNFLCPYLYEDGDNKGLSGETLYCLRNVYLHQGSINIHSDKLKDKNNRIDKFALVVGKDQILNEFNIVVSEYGNTFHRAEAINVKYLCLSICECVQYYYDSNKSKFSFEFNVVPEEYLFPHEERKQRSDSEQPDKLFDEDEIAKHAPRIAKIIHDYEKSIGFNPYEVLNEEVKGKEIQKEPEKTKHKESKKKVISKRESQIRSYFGQHFKKQFYKDNKEKIINAVLKSKTKLQVKNKLLKAFSDKEAGEIYKKLLPLIIDMPGR